MMGILPEDGIELPEKPEIEGNPYISTVPVEPGLTNAGAERSGQRIVGFNSEHTELNEGMVRFDIVFYVRMKAGISRIIINLEAQKDEPKGYGILNRAIFYVSRLVSSQKERDFEKTDYDDIKCVYSIWICMNVPRNSLNHIHLTNDSLLGDYEWKGKLNLLNIIMIGLAEELPEHDEKHELHRLLGALLSNELTIDEKLNIMKSEYDIPVEDKFREDVSVMCNLSEGVFEKGMKKGMEKGMETLIAAMHKNGLSAEQIAAVADMDIKRVEAIINGTGECSAV